MAATNNLSIFNVPILKKKLYVDQNFPSAGVYVLTVLPYLSMLDKGRISISPLSVTSDKVWIESSVSYQGVSAN